MPPPLLPVASRDINTITDKIHGRTELHLAAIKGSTYEIRRLIGLGHNPGIKDNYGKTASSLSMFYHGRDLVTAVQNSDFRGKNEDLKAENNSLKRKLEDLKKMNDELIDANNTLQRSVDALTEASEGRGRKRSRTSKGGGGGEGGE
jgi:FtsZ-binding cell division protein ZapB